MRRAPAPAKLNLALVVGPHRTDGKHEVTTVLQRVDLADRVALAPSGGLRVDGFAEDTLVTAALIALAARAGVEPHWRATLTKRVPVAGGLGGGSSDAATALRLANETLREPLPLAELHELAAGLGADVPFFLRPGPQLGEGDGTTLRPLRAPAGLLGRAAPSARRGEKRRRAPSTRASTSATGRPATRNGAPRSSTRSAACAARATSPRCRRTTSPRRRSPTSCVTWAPSAPTSPAPARPSTGSSPAAATRRRRAAGCGGWGRPGSTVPAWYG